MLGLNIRSLLVMSTLIMPLASHAIDIFYCRGTTDIFEGTEKINSIDDVRSYDVDTFTSSSACKQIEKITVCRFAMDGINENDNKKHLVITKIRFNKSTRRVSENTYMRREGSLTAATFNGVCEIVSIETND